VGVKAKATIKKVTMNGNEFKSRSVTLYVCDKSDCSDKSESNATKYSDLKDTDAKTITMPEAKGKKDQYVVLYDRVVYGADQVSEKASSIKKLSVATASASPTVTEEVAEATPDATMEEMAQPTPEATPVEAAATSSGLPMGVILGVLGVLVITLLIVIIVLLARKKK
jgi:cobalamin biosynthesis Mg chelatase CobN